ncbi:MAG: glycosyltransferase [Alistipes shahii]
MENCRALVYPEGAGRHRLGDGRIDRPHARIAGRLSSVTVFTTLRRGGQTAALNRALEHIHTPIVVFTDANTMLNSEAVTEIVRRFDDPQVGASPARSVAAAERSGAAATEGVYWKYESKLKEWDCRLHLAVGAAGELFAVARPMAYDARRHVMDDFVCPMLIAADGYRIAWHARRPAPSRPRRPTWARRASAKRRIALSDYSRYGACASC